MSINELNEINMDKLHKISQNIFKKVIQLIESKKLAGTLHYNAENELIYFILSLLPLYFKSANKNLDANIIQDLSIKFMQFINSPNNETPIILQ